MGKGIPAAHWASVAEKGFQLAYGATANLSPTVMDVTSVAGRRRQSSLDCPMSTPSKSFRGTPRVARVFCTLFRGREEVEDPGGYLASDCRGNLRRLHQRFIKSKGLTLRARNDVAQDQARRHSVGGRHDKAMLLPH